MLDIKMDHRLDDYAHKITERDYINRELYQKYDVKHGLRYPDGTGVLVGITRIGFVTGYEKKRRQKNPRRRRFALSRLFRKRYGERF